MFVMFKVISATVGLRVKPEEELEGLDVGEHGANAYPDFAPSPSSGGMSAPPAMAIPESAVQRRADGRRSLTGATAWNFCPL